MDWIAVNLNQPCRVKLTELGRRLHEEDHKVRWAGIPLEYHAPVEDADGWSKWQLWSLMQAFGPHLHLGMSEMPFVLDIEIQPTPPTTPAPQPSEDKQP